MNIPTFNNPDLLRQSFIHRSYLNEHKDISFSNERLEFLGDAILSFVVSNWIYSQLPNEPEGVLTSIRSNLVNTKSLAKVASLLDLGKYMLLSKGEEEGGGRTNTSLLADTYEAVIGAIFLDQGLESTQDFISSTLLSGATNLTQNLKDPKSLLQEVVQAKKIGSPIYRVVSETGPDHNKTFLVEVEVNGETLSSGQGKSKREAEVEAASQALAKIGEQW